MIYVWNDYTVKPVYKGHSNLYIKATQENLKMCSLLAVALYTGADPGGVHTTKIGKNKKDFLA